MKYCCLLVLFICAALAVKDGECDSSLDQFPSKVHMTNSSIYDVEYHNTYAEVTVKVPYGSTYTYTLVRRNCEPPTDPYIFLFNTLRKGLVITIPVRTITVLETTSSAYLYELGALNMIKATCTQSYFSYKPVKSYIEDMQKKGTPIKDIDDFIGGYSQNSIDKVMEVGSDVSIGSHYTLLANMTKAKLFLEESSFETNQLGVAEVIKVLGLLTGAEDVANNIFDRIYKDYQETLEEVKDLLENELGDSNENKKKVLIGGIMSDWYTGEAYWATAGGYTRQIIEDAGANILADSSIDQALESGKTADVWINVGTGYFTRTEALLVTDYRYGKIKPLQEGNVYDRNLKVDQDPNHDYSANEFFQTAQLFPNLVLKDLVKIFYPQLMVIHQFQYYMKITPADISSNITWNDESTYPANCVVGNWSEWSDCSEKCDEGIQTRSRKVTTPSKNGGEACPALEEKKSCYKKCSQTTLIIILVVVFVVVIVVAAVIVWFCVARCTKNKIRSQLINKTPEEQKEIINHLVEI